MEAWDLSARHIGKTITVEWDSLDGETNSITGQLEQVNVLTEKHYKTLVRAPQVSVSNIEVSISGHTLYLRGGEAVSVHGLGTSVTPVTE